MVKLRGCSFRGFGGSLCMESVQMADSIIVSVRGLPRDVRRESWWLEWCFRGREPLRKALVVCTECTNGSFSLFPSFPTNQKQGRTD